MIFAAHWVRIYILASVCSVRLDHRELDGLVRCVKVTCGVVLVSITRLVSVGATLVYV